MQNPYDQMSVVFGHQNLFGRTLDLSELIELVAPYPASQWLELCAKIEGLLLMKRSDIPDVHKYLAGILFPPSTLRRMNRQQDEKVIIFSLGQLNLLRKVVIAYGRNNGDENEMRIPKTSISQAFLAAQDFHNDYDTRVGRSGDLENFCQFVIRNGYLNCDLDAAGLFSRGHRMYILLGQKFNFRDDTFSKFFRESVGLSIPEAMSLSFALAVPFSQDKETLTWQTTIIDPKTYFENLIIDKKLTETIVTSITDDFANVKAAILKEFEGSNFHNTPIGYNLDIFRKTPFIRLENGKLVCASLSCLTQKTTQNLIWMLKSMTKGLNKRDENKLVIDLASYRGKLFEEYVKELCQEMEEKNAKMIFHYIPPEATRNNEEVGDSILIQGSDVLILEAKSRQFKEAFKYTGIWDQDKLFIEELVRKAAEQIEIATKKIMNGEVTSLPLREKIARVYPAIVTYEPVPMHGKVQKYIREKLEEFELLTDPIFAPLEILHVSDLESLMDGINTYTLIDILKEKGLDGMHASETNFNNFYSFFVNKKGVISNGWGSDCWKEVWNEVFMPSLKFKSTSDIGSKHI